MKALEYITKLKNNSHQTKKYHFIVCCKQLKIKYEITICLKKSYKESNGPVETYLQSLNIFMTRPHSDQVIWSSSKQISHDHAHNKDEIDISSQHLDIFSSWYTKLPIVDFIKLQKYFLDANGVYKLLFATYIP